MYVYQYMCVYDLCTLLAEEGNNEVQGLYYPLDRLQLPWLGDGFVRITALNEFKLVRID